MVQVAAAALEGAAEKVGVGDVALDLALDAQVVHDREGEAGAHAVEQVFELVGRGSGRCLGRVGQLGRGRLGDHREGEGFRFGPLAMRTSQRKRTGKGESDQRVAPRHSPDSSSGRDPS